MARVRQLQVQHIRTHAQYKAALSPGVTLITGANGAGKTSLIEALYISLQGSSFKGSDGDVLTAGQSWYRIDVAMDDDTTRIVKFDASRTNGRKQFTIDEKVNYRLLPQHKHPVVLFEPDDLRLLSGSPTRRRQFIDRLAGQLDPAYTTALHRYERALRQRNALLKKPRVADNDLFAWDVTLSEYGAYVIEQRVRFLAEINQQLAQTYQKISKTKDVVTVHYSKELHANSKQLLLNHLHHNAERDKLLGFTSTGPHRDDLLFEFNTTPAMQVASRGEVRSIILALKFLEAQSIEKTLTTKPIILLDDVFSELDETRQKNLATEFTDHQIIITSVNAIPIKSSQQIRL